MKIALVGVGYVGLVSAACFADLGAEVYCIDVNQEKIEGLKKGIIPIYEPALDQLVLRGIKANRLHFSTSITEILSDIEILYHPKTQIYTIHDRKKFINIHVNAHSGERMDTQLDHDNLFKEKSGLGWIHSIVGFVLKAPFEISFIILSLTGAYLFLFPYLKRMPAKKQGVLGMRPSQKFIYLTTKNQKDIRRLAALGLLPGVSVTILHMPARAPVILSALHTRIAISRDIAATIIASEE